MGEGAEFLAIHMLTLLDLVRRDPQPVPWAEGDNIPWNEPAFSQRMLREHLSQDHDAASRRFEKIDRQVEWIHTVLLKEKSGRILDLACGPGLYAERLARCGHACVGIDFSPASIEYAREVAQRDSLSCSYQKQDLRQAAFGSGFDLAMLIYGEFNVFRPADALSILQKACRALKPGGVLLLEVHTFDTLYRMGHAQASWYTCQQGVYSDRPYLLLKESFWDEASQVATNRYFVVDTATATVQCMAASYQAYSEDGYRSLLAEAGFNVCQIYPALGGIETDGASGLVAIMAQKTNGFELNQQAFIGGFG